MRKGLNESVERSQDEVCGVYHGGGIRGRGHERCGFAGQPQAAILAVMAPCRGLAEELGFEAMWLGEHHFGSHGVGNVPNPTWARPSRTAPKATDLTSPPWGGGGNQAAVAQPLAAPKSARCRADTPRSGLLACENGPRAVSPLTTHSTPLSSHDAANPLHSMLSDCCPLSSDANRSDLVSTVA